MKFFNRRRETPARPSAAPEEILPSNCALDGLLRTAPAPVMCVDGQISQYDRLLYYWVAKEFYSGAGSIVDGGVLVGGTTVCLGEGLLANQRVEAADGIIHVYDLFTDARDGYSAVAIKNWYNETADNAEIYDFSGISAATWLNLSAS